MPSSPPLLARPRGARAVLPALAAVATLAAACGDPGDEDHELFSRVEIETRGLASELLAVWTSDDGWQDAAEEDSIDTLPHPVDDEAENLSPLRAYGDRASLTVRMFRGEEQYETDTVARDDATGERECTEFSAIYDVVLDDPDAETDVLAWPPEPHPEGPEGLAQFAAVEDAGGDTDLAAIFHCDHIYIYPQSEGREEIRIVLWHIDHSDDFTDPIGIEVEPAP